MPFLREANIKNARTKTDFQKGHLLLCDLLKASMEMKYVRETAILDSKIHTHTKHNLCSKKQNRVYSRFDLLLDNFFLNI